MAKAEKQSSRSRQQDRAQVAGGQDYDQLLTLNVHPSQSASALRRSIRRLSSKSKLAPFTQHISAVAILRDASSMTLLVAVFHRIDKSGFLLTPTF
jgi:hypothetical protein